MIENDPIHLRGAVAGEFSDGNWNEIVLSVFVYPIRAPRNVSNDNRKGKEGVRERHNGCMTSSKYDSEKKEDLQANQWEEKRIIER